MKSTDNEEEIIKRTLKTTVQRLLNEIVTNRLINECVLNQISNLRDELTRLTSQIVPGSVF